MTEDQTRFTPGEVLAQIATRLVSLHKQYYGKGPVKAKAFLVNDTVMCTLEGGFTVVERTLIDTGRERSVHDIRSSFQAAMEGEFTTVIEETLGRTVRAYMSMVHTNPDVAVELFMLEPLDKTGASASSIFEEEFGADHD